MPRPRAFDEDVVLDAAIELFWVRGYRAASLSDLSAVTGVGNGSLYQAWGSKWALFLAAFERYCAGRVSLVDGAVGVSQPTARDVALGYLDAIIADCGDHPDRRGCLMINAISELGSTEEVRTISDRAIAGMENSVAEALARATDRPVEDADIRASAAQLVALSQALIQLSRIRRSEDELRSIARNAASSVDRLLRAA